MIIGVLVLALAFSLGFNVYYYSAMVTKQAMINDMRGHITVALGEANERCIVLFTERNHKH